MARSVGIELTQSKIKILAVDHSSRKFRISSYFEADYTPNPEKPWEDIAKAAMAEALGKARVSRNRVAVSVDSGEAVIRELTLPFKDDAQVRQTVRYEMESLIHNYAIEDLVVDHYKTGETDKGTMVLAAAVPKELLLKRLKIFTGCGVDPHTVDLDVCALYNALFHSGAIDSDEPFLILHGTSKFSKIIFVEQKKPKSIRTLRFGFTPPATPEEIEERKIHREWETKEVSHPVPILLLEREEVAHFSDLKPEEQDKLIGILTKEIFRFLLAITAAQPSHILLTGDFDNESAAQKLTELTQIPTRTHNILDILDHDLPAATVKEGHKVGVPLGLALKAADFDVLGLDFRRQEFKYARKFEVIRATALVTLELIVIFLAAVGFHFYLQKKELMVACADWVTVYHKGLYEEVAEETLKKEDLVKDPGLPYRKTKELWESQNELSGGGDYPIDSALELWAAMFSVFNDFVLREGRNEFGGKKFNLTLEEIKFSQTERGREILLRGKACSTELTEPLKLELRKTPFFSEIDYEGKIDPQPDGSVSFRLKQMTSKK